MGIARKVLPWIGGCNAPFCSKRQPKVRFLQHLFFQTSISFTMASLQSLYMALQDGEGFSVNTDQKTFTGRGYAVGGTEIPALVVENDSLSFNTFSDAMLNMASKMLDPDTQVIGGWVDAGMTFIEALTSSVSTSPGTRRAPKRKSHLRLLHAVKVRNPSFISGTATKQVSVARETAKTIEHEHLGTPPHERHTTKP